ncbi:MAG: PAS domain-containing protein, partial [Gammaproteobacteria bacterium]
MPDTPVSTHAAFDDDPERLRETLDSLLEGVQILSRDWRYVYVNRAVAAHGRKSPEDLLGKTLFECYAGIESTRAFAELERCMQERRPSRIENEFEYEDGDRRWFELRIHPCREGLIVLSLDISERKQLEASLRQSQHLKALGQFAAGIAHDLKNFLTPISLQVSILQSLVDQDAEVRQTLAYIDSILKRGDETIQVLQDFARQAPERHRLEQVQPDDVMRQARQLGLGGVEPGRFELQETLEAAVPVRVRPAELLS